MLTTTTHFTLLPGDDHDLPTLPVRVTLSYDAAAPYLVRAAFHTGKTSKVVWDLSRDLLAAGLHSRAGEGDVEVVPDPTRPGCLRLTLRSTEGRAVFAVPTAAIAEFLARTYGVVPLGAETEAVDIDAALAALLEEREPALVDVPPCTGCSSPLCPDCQGS
jgi:hypothetical protein